MNRDPFRRSFHFLLLLVAAGLLASSGCSDDKTDTTLGPTGSSTGGGGGGGGGGPVSATYSGMFVSGAGFGSVNLTITSANPVRGLRAGVLTYPVAGTLQEEGKDPVPLDGLYNPGTGHLSVSDSGYTFSGTHALVNGAEIIDGSWVGPNGSGWFGTSRGTSLHSTAAYGGTYEMGTVTSGYVALLVTDGFIRARWYPIYGSQLAVRGSIGSGIDVRPVTLYASSGLSDIFNGSGYLNGSTKQMQGTWKRLINLDLAGSGTWEAAPVP